jgi:folate-binding protein YgfZ
MTSTNPWELTAGHRVQRDEIVIAVEGDDARAWLNGQMTNDLKRLTRDSGVYGLVLTLKGRVLADLFAFEHGSTLCFAVDRAVWPALREQLERYIIMEDVTLRETQLRVVSVCGARVEALDLAPLAAGGACVVRHLRLGPSREVVVEEGSLVPTLEKLAAALAAIGADGAEIDEQEWERARIAMGVPRFPVDFGDRTYPQEAGLKRRALAFDKGCYLGQEVVCMLENRGQVTRSLVRLAIESGASVGAPLRRGADVVGELTSVSGGRGLGLVKRALTEPGTALESDRGPATVLGLVD